MKTVPSILLLLFSFLLMSTSDCEYHEPVPPPIVIDTTFVHMQFSDYTIYGENVMYIDASDDNFGRILQQWITANPTEVVTAIAYDANSGDNNYPDGYFIIHYPDTTFNPFKIKG